MKSELDLLKQVQKAEVSPFLYTRILQRVADLGNAPAPVKWRFAFAVITVTLLVLNISIIFFAKPKQRGNDIEKVISSLNLSSSNELYHE